MLPEDFVKTIIELYKEARTIKDFGVSVKSVVRGRSKCISSEIEDLLATYIATQIEDIKIYVNQPIIYKVDNKDTKILPDILITMRAEDDKEKIIYLADLKNDLGYQRYLIDEPNQSISRENTYWKYVDWVNQLKGNNVSIQDKQTGARFVQISKALRFDIIIVSGKNAGKKDTVFKQTIDVINQKNIPMKIWVLTDGAHPNNYDDTNKPITKPSKDLTNLIDSIASLK